MSDVYIIGAGIHKFGRTEERTGREQGIFAVNQALQDAGLEWSDVQFAAGGSRDGGNADIMLNDLGLSTIPFVNVFNGCATGGSALAMAKSAIAAGECDIAMAVGYDKHPRGAFTANPKNYGLPDWYGQTGMMMTTQFFALKIQRYMQLHGISRETLGRVANKSFRNAEKADHAWRRQPIDIDTIMESQVINDPLTKYMFCAPGEGGVALILASGKKVRELGADAVKVSNVTIRSRPRGSFEVYSPTIDLVDEGIPTTLASKAAYEAAGIGPEDIDVAQLQDTEAGAEILHMAENGICKDGEQEQWLAEGRTELDGALPINTDGGCIACGEPIGATGLRQIYENVTQLRGRGGARQVQNKPKTAYSHVYGAPGLSGITILEV